VKKIKFFQRKPSKNVQRNSAIHRAKKASKMNYLRKVGRLPEEETFRRPRR